MGAPKLSLELTPGRTLGAAALEELAACDLRPLIVVVRADDPLDWLPEPGESPAWRTVTCLTAHLGMSFSLRCGLSAAKSGAPDAVLVALGDQPFVTAGELRKLLEAFAAEPGLDYAAGANGGRAMPPAVFGKSMFAELERLDGDQGARGLFESRDYRGIVVAPESPDYFADADTQEDFLRLKRLWSNKT